MQPFRFQIFFLLMFSIISVTGEEYVNGISHEHSGPFTYERLKDKGYLFAYILTTRGKMYASPAFNVEKNNAKNAGLYVGGYHIAIPKKSAMDGQNQASFFVSSGGGWSKDGKSLPGALILLFLKYKRECYGLGTEAVVNWVDAFVTTYTKLTGRYPVIYASKTWWKKCTGENGQFGKLPYWAPATFYPTPQTPQAWEKATFWEYGRSFDGSGQSYHKFIGTIEGLNDFALQGNKVKN